MTNSSTGSSLLTSANVTRSKLARVCVRRATAGDGTAIKRRRYFAHSLSPNGWRPDELVPTIDIDRGALYVNGLHIVAPRITRDQITWHQQVRGPKGDQYSAGHLFLHSNGVEAHGVVSVGRTAADAQQREILATAVPAVSYVTQITTQTYPPNTSPSQIPADKWSPGLSLVVSYQQAVGSSVPSPVVTLDGQDITAQCSWGVNDEYTVLTISLSASDCAFAPNLYCQATLSFDAYSLQAPGNGNVSQQCSNPSPAANNSVWLWKAVCVSQSSDLAAKKPARLPSPQRMMFAATDVVPPSDLSLAELMTILPDDSVNSDANTMLMRNMKWAMGQDPTENGWLQEFFSEAPPVIPDPAQVALATQSLNWYQKKFAMAYLTQSFNSYKGANAPTSVLNSTQADNLTTYLQSGLAKEKDFNVQQTGIFVEAFVAAKPRLQAYIDDTTSAMVGWAQGTVIFTRKDASLALTLPAGVGIQTPGGVAYTTQAAVTLAAGQTTSPSVVVAAVSAGPSGIVGAGQLTAFVSPVTGIDSVTNAAATTLAADSGGLKWAKMLFAALTTGPQFILMVNRVAGAAGDPKALGPANNLACLLTALDSSGQLASNYFQAVLSGLVVNLVPQVVHGDSATTMEWLPTTMQEVLRQLAAGELPQEADISQAEATDMFQEYLKHQSEIAMATADLLQSIKASGLVAQSQAAEAQFQNSIASRWPKLAKASRFMLAFGWIGAVSSVIVSLTNGDWKKMTDVQKAEFVTNIVQLTVTGFDAVPLIWQGTKYVTLGIWNKLNSWWSSPPRQVEIQMREGQIAPDPNVPVPEQIIDNVDELIHDAEPQDEALGQDSIWSRIFAEGKFAGALKCVGALAAAAMAAYAVWQLIDDIKDGGSVSTIVFDSLSLAANALSAICIVADLFVATSFLPIAGAVLALAGVIIGMIAGFFEKPDNPVNDWMEQNGIPFANSLATS